MNTIKIKFLQDRPFRGEIHPAGTEIEMDAVYANALIRMGWAEEVKSEPPPPPADPEKPIEQKPTKKTKKCPL